MYCTPLTVIVASVGVVDPSSSSRRNALSFCPSRITTYFSFEVRSIKVMKASLRISASASPTSPSNSFEMNSVGGRFCNPLRTLLTAFSCFSHCPSYLSTSGCCETPCKRLGSEVLIKGILSYRIVSIDTDSGSSIEIVKYCSIRTLGVKLFKTSFRHVFVTSNKCF